MLWHCYSHPFDIAHAPELLAGIATSDGMLVINTEFKTKEECPIQPNFSSNTEGYIEIFNKICFWPQGYLNLLTYIYHLSI